MSSPPPHQDTVNHNGDMKSPGPPPPLPCGGPIPRGTERPFPSPWKTQRENQKKKTTKWPKKTMEITSKSWETMTLLDNLIKILIISVQHSSRKVMTDIVWTLDAKGVSVVLNHRLIRMAAKFCSSRWFIPWNQPMFYSLSWESQ